MTDIEKQQRDAQNLNELVDYIANLVEENNERFNFEFAVGGTMEIYDKEKDIGYAVHIEPIKYDKNGNVVNL